MITITNKKVAGYRPIWESFNGFSLLFDNPGESFRDENDLLHVNCNINDPNLELYRNLKKSIDRIGLDLLVNTYLFCPLPTPSYHVTVWDGVNDGKINESEQHGFRKFLSKLPKSMTSETAFKDLINSSPLVTEKQFIKFKFSKLTQWQNSVLVAEIEPAGEDSRKQLRKIKEARVKLNDKFKEQFGIRPSNSSYNPHISLGYFANKENAELTNSRMNDWNNLFKKNIRGVNIKYESISLHGFTDMSNFFKDKCK